MAVEEEVAVWDERADKAPEDTALDWANDVVMMSNALTKTGSFFINDSLF